MRSLAAVHGVDPLPELGIPTAIQHQGDGNPDGDMAGAQDTIYLCNFRVSVDGEWLCLKELHDMEMQDSFHRPSAQAITSPDDPMNTLMGKLMRRTNAVSVNSNDNKKKNIVICCSTGSCCDRTQQSCEHLETDCEGADRTIAPIW